MAAGNIASSDLLWLLTKGGNSFTHKRTGAYRVFTAEPNNVTNIHAAKFSGLANDRSITAVAPKSGNGVTLVTRDPKASRFAAASAYKRNTVRGKGRKVAGAVAKAVGSDAGRLDLRSLVQARASAILAQQSTRKAQRVRAARGNKA